MSISDFLHSKILQIGEFKLYTYNLLILLVFVSFVAIALKLIKNFIYKSPKLDSAKKFAFSRLIQYIVITVAFLVALQILGFKISVLLAGSAAVLVGLGFGLQNLFNDFISGVILLLEGTLRVGDIIEVNQTIYKVLEINFRTTKVIGRNDDYVILPNSILTSNQVINWTHDSISSRFSVKVGVDYSSDVSIVMNTLLDSVKHHPEVLSQPAPFVRLEDFADSALIFGVYYYSDEIFWAERVKSEIRILIFKNFKTNNIKIPFPQRVVHMQ